MKTLAIIGLAILMSGCSQLAKISDDDLARDLTIGSRSAVKYSLQLALRKAAPDEAARIKADAKTAADIITKNVIPVFSGTQTNELLRSAVDTALALLKSKITNPKVVAAVDLGIEVIAMDVQLPKNPADRLDDRTRKAILGIFSGITQGVSDAVPDLAPTAPARDTMSLPK